MFDGDMTGRSDEDDATLGIDGGVLGAGGDTDRAIRLEGPSSGLDGVSGSLKSFPLAERRDECRLGCGGWNHK